MPLLILLLGIVTVIGMILVLRVNAFVALISAAMLVSLLSPGQWGEKIKRVAEAFGETAGGIGIVIALAAVIGKCLMDSGAADRIVRSFLKVLGEKRASVALMGSGFVLSVPVFFDTVFYLLVPLARSLWRRTHKNYVLYITAIATGGALTHTLVPPTPGPLLMAEALGIDLGVMIIGGALIGLPTAVVGLLICRLMNRWLDLPVRPYSGEPEPEPLEDDQLPGLWISLLPVLLPVILISANTLTKMLAESDGSERMQQVANVAALLGNPNLALLLSAAIAMGLLVRQRGLTLSALGKTTETALMSGGVIILITSAGGAFGKMLRQCGIEESIQRLAGTGEQNVGMILLCLGFVIATVMKVAQGSGTVSMIVTSGIMASMGITSGMLGCHMVYLATAIGAGSLVGSWMNDSGFWIFARMSGLTEAEALKTWTVLLAILGTVAFGFTLLAARFLPMV